MALGLTFVYMLAEAIGGWLVNSLALMADAGHMLTDVAALSLTLAAIWFASRPANARKTYGYYRLEILAALINGVTLVLIALWVFYEAYERWTVPPEIMGLQMTMIAVGGLTVNIICAWLLHGDHKHDLNMRGAWLHVMGDVLGSITAIIAGVLIITLGWFWVDALSSALISLIIIFSAWNLIRESVNVLLEGTPAHINLALVEDAIMTTDGVRNIHDLHVWTISSGMEALSAHVCHEKQVGQQELLKRLRKLLHDEFGIDHLTIQMETQEFEDEKVHFCQTGSKCFDSTGRFKIIKN